VSRLYKSLQTHGPGFCGVQNLSMFSLIDASIVCAPLSKQK